MNAQPVLVRSGFLAVDESRAKALGIDAPPIPTGCVLLKAIDGSDVFFNRQMLRSIRQDDNGTWNLFYGNTTGDDGLGRGARNSREDAVRWLVGGE